MVQLERADKDQNPAVQKHSAAPQVILRPSIYYHSPSIYHPAFSTPYGVLITTECTEDYQTLRISVSFGKQMISGQ